MTPPKTEPTGPRPPLPGTVRIEFNWLASTGPQAHNIGYAQTTDDSSTSDPTTLLAIANGIMTLVASDFPLNHISNSWQVTSVTVSDNGGSSEEQAISTHAAVVGTDSTDAFPPNCAVCISWAINARYRGGKPRWYLPGLTNLSTGVASAAMLTTSAATAFETQMNTFLTGFNSGSYNGHLYSLGTISYFTNYTLRATPLFRVFQGASVHQRVDSQRRRLGKESAYPVVLP